MICIHISIYCILYTHFKHYHIIYIKFYKRCITLYNIFFLIHNIFILCCNSLPSSYNISCYIIKKYVYHKYIVILNKYKILGVLWENIGLQQMINKFYNKHFLNNPADGLRESKVYINKYFLYTHIFMYYI